MTTHADARHRSPRRRQLGAFTMVELLVVMGIIAVLAAALLVATDTVLRGQKERNTRTVLQIVSDAVEEFKREQQARATITRAPNYKKRFGLYPPDELEWFTTETTSTKTLAQSYAPSRAIMAPAPPSGKYTAMRFYTNGTSDDFFEFRDQLAMITAIETLGDASATILDRLDRRYRRAILDPNNDDDPAVFLERTPASAPSWDSDDKQIDLIVDAWGTPISYLAQRDWRPGGGVGATDSSNHPSWNEASSEIIKANRGQPLIFSYGRDGPDQLKPEVMEAGILPEGGEASLTGDFENETPPNEHGAIRHLMNEDNVYLDPQFNEQLAEGES